MENHKRSTQTAIGAPKLQLECAHASLGMHQGMEVNGNIKQAAGNGKPQKEHPKCNWSTKTTIGVPAHGIGHASGMEVNMNTKQAVGNGKPQKEHPTCIRAWR